MKLFLPTPGVVAAAGIAELLALGGAAALDQPDPQAAFPAVLYGLATAIPIVAAIAIWFGKDHLALKEMHQQNTRRLDRIILAVEGEDGLLAEKKISIDAREGVGRILADVVTHVLAIERHLRRCGERDGMPFDPPPTDVLPHRRRGDVG